MKAFALWPHDVPAPSAWLELDLEPWGQTVARLLSPEGILVGLLCTPWMHESRD